MTWVGLISRLLAFVNSLITYISAERMKQLGRLQEKADNDAKNAEIVARVDAANPDSVPNDKIVRRE